MSPDSDSADKISDHSFFSVFKIEEALDVPPYETPRVIAIRRFQQILQINRPCCILPDIAPRLLRAARKMPDLHISPECRISGRLVPHAINLDNVSLAHKVDYV